ncbi:unnamed protein product [Thlaspi arvense]|uniref:Uncharacterized protein n=1 Tax=Thlaspi arvense TaxID=13288 RepID=A0AAU9RW92_THLAR|nr:unnamed protein product [Thlaspi arvense]
MGGNNRQSKSLFSIFNIFKSKRSTRRGDDYSGDDSVKRYRVWPSDEDRDRWVAEYDIDRKASAYIAMRRAATKIDDE